MKIPKERNKYCKYCKKYTAQKIKKVKNKPRRCVAVGQRRHLRKVAGYGSFPAKKPKGRGKPSTKLDLRYTCSECGKQNIIGKGFRVKKMEFV
ncbi:MAG: 50S ribosomal protein L44e [Candidatus Aenigmatarchaeota archaeon]|nr:50S ribosomal protein L44e [Candidatus Aenigmarchaeota archaeon]RLJ01030.1 MAG: 50S ribosomal protein L44e [Candidatus Aenigmarchaeota archaeon]